MPKISELPNNTVALTGSELLAVVQAGVTFRTTLLQIAQSIPQWSSVAGTIAVGTVTTGDAGTSVIITNIGTSTAAILNFTIPKGDQGIQGIQGIKGDQGIQGIQGLPGRVSILGRFL